VAGFRDQVVADGGKILAALEGLRAEIQELKDQGDRLRSDEVSLKDLEDKFQKHFQGIAQ
jgi:hypothetical protein